MIKHLRLATIAASVLASGFSYGQNRLPKLIAAEATSTNSPKLNTAKMATTCGPDFVDYSFKKIDTLNTTNANPQYLLDVWPGEQVSTGFALDQAATVSGAYILGRVGPTSTAPRTVTVAITSLDSAFRPSIVLGTTTAVLTSTSGFVLASFATPIAVSDSFAIVVINDTLVNPADKDTIQLFHTNVNYPAANLNAPWVEDISYYDFGGGWEPFMDVMGYEAEIRLLPVVTYDATADFMTANDSACAGKTVNFVNMSSPIYQNRMFNLHEFDEYWLGETDSTFAWNFGDGSTVVYGESPSHTYNTAGTYTVTLTGNVRGYYSGICSDVKTMQIVIVEPVATITPSGNQSICTGDSLLLQGGTMEAGSVYQWLLDGVTIAGADTASIYAKTAGAYRFIVTNTLGCVDTSAATILNVAGAPPVATTSAGGPTTICSGDSVLLEGTPNAGATYQWLINGTAITGANSASYYAQPAGDYTLVVTNGCGTDTSDTPITVSVNPVPATPTLTQNVNTLSSSAATGNQFYLNGSPIAGATGTSYTATANGNYFVIVTDPNTGCMSDTSNVLNVIVTGIDQLNKTSYSVIYNSSAKTLNITLTNVSDAKIGVYNVVGKLIATASSRSAYSATVNMSDAAEGTYFVRIETKEGVKALKFVVTQ